MGGSAFSGAVIRDCLAISRGGISLTVTQRTRDFLARSVADDAVGGFFALNGGGLPGPARNVFYLAPDSLRWEDTGRGYADFLNFACIGDLVRFYRDHRWNGWERDVATLAGDRAFHFVPMLCMKSDGGIETRHRKDVPVEELWGLHAFDLPKQLLASGPGR